MNVFNSRFRSFSVLVAQTIFAIGIVALPLAELGPVKASVVETREEILDGFEKLAFGSNYGDPQQDHIVKWSSDVFVNYSTDNLDALKASGGLEALWEYMTLANRVVGNILKADKNEKPDVLVIFYEKDDFPISILKEFINGVEYWSEESKIILNIFVNKLYKNEEPPCNFQTADIEGKLFKAVIYIPISSSRAHLRSCIHEEMTHSLGLTNDPPSLRNSIFNKSENQPAITGNDLYYLQLLYDERITAGMARKEALDVLKFILNENIKLK